ncbi:hypothetical protein ACIGZJ_31210 [Kitasatospora sp. NPDC052868]|uniref:hypothetical protein n=1 Tax=Kitasatospora sp. NPDC052868 TaxID=3364060 RepID=UPI0037CB369A
MALRRERDAGEWTILPAEGRQGEAPDWPLTEQSLREDGLWQCLWAKPQALMWERYGQELEVALYIRRLTEAELADSRVTLTTVVKQMADSLGLTTPGMRANRWRIIRDEEQAAARPAAGAGPAMNRQSARSRLQVVTGDGA